MNYDVFVSYRRLDGVYPAMLLHRDLVEAGYKVFYDIANLQSGPFPKIIEGAVTNCTDFLLVVTESTFSERIMDENDWVRREIKLAIQHNKNIIPIFIGNVTVPNNLPEDIKTISDYQGVSQLDPILIKEIHNKMFKELMKSKISTQEENETAHLRCSIYDASYGDEFDRLMIQSNNSLIGDLSVINDELKKEKDVVVLDVGCAYGIVGKTRFSNQRFSKIIGIDYNERCVEKAIEANEDERFVYANIDVESDVFSEGLEELMAKNNIEGFDVIFLAHILLHLKNPLRFLRVVHKYLAKDGIIIVRGADDRSKLAYEDNENLLKEIIDFTASIDGVSDRFNGEKIYANMLKAGYKDIKMYSFMRDTSSMEIEDKQMLFNESFSYRINEVKRHYQENPTDKEKKKDFDRMELLLARFEEKFYEPAFWYCEYDYIGVGRK